MQFGVKQGVEPAFDPEMAGPGGSFIKYFKEHKTTLRFLEEIEDWTSVWMHFNNTKNRDYPCTDDKPTCPGHNSENEREAKPAKRYIVNALNVETGFVDLYKIPFSLIDDLKRQSDKFGTITDRDYTIYKDQTAGKTDYSVDREEKTSRDLAEYRGLMKDHQTALAEAFREMWNGLPDEPEYTGGEVFGTGAVSNAGYLKPLDEPRAVRGQHPSVPEYADPPSEPADQQDEGQREITVEQLNAMDVNEVIEVYKIAQIPVPAFKDHDDLVKQLVAALS